MISDLYLKGESVSQKKILSIVFGLKSLIFDGMNQFLKSFLFRLSYTGWGKSRVRIVSTSNREFILVLLLTNYCISSEPGGAGRALY